MALRLPSSGSVHLLDFARLVSIFHERARMESSLWVSVSRFFNCVFCFCSFYWVTRMLDTTSSLMFFLLFLKSEHSRLLRFWYSLLDLSKGTCVLAPVTAECLGVGIWRAHTLWLLGPGSRWLRAVYLACAHILCLPRPGYQWLTDLLRPLPFAVQKSMTATCQPWNLPNITVFEKVSGVMLLLVLKKKLELHLEVEF